MGRRIASRLDLGDAPMCPKALVIVTGSAGPRHAPTHLSVFRVSDNGGSGRLRKNIELWMEHRFPLRIMKSRCSEFGCYMASHLDADHCFGLCCRHYADIFLCDYRA